MDGMHDNFIGRFDNIDITACKLMWKDKKHLMVNVVHKQNKNTDAIFSATNYRVLFLYVGLPVAMTPRILFVKSPSAIEMSRPARAA